MSHNIDSVTAVFRKICYYVVVGTFPLPNNTTEYKFFEQKPLNSMRDAAGGCAEDIRSSGADRETGQPTIIS